jgi:uncharacterized protein (DUF1778 family)
MERRKPDDKRRTKYLRVRLTAEQDALLRAAADSAGITVSSWAVERLVKAAKNEQRTKGAAPPGPIVPGGAPS